MSQNKKILLRCDEEQFSQIQAFADQSGMSQNQWILAQCLKNSVPTASIEDLRATLEKALAMLPRPNPSVDAIKIYPSEIEQPMIRNRIKKLFGRISG